MQEKSRLESEIARSERLQGLKNDVADWLDLAGEEESQETLEPLAEAIATLAETLAQAELDMLLSAKEDRENVILEIHPGAGGTEAQDWASMLLRMYQRWADARHFTTEILDYLDGDEAGLKSVTLGIKGENAYGLLKSEKGIHRLIRISPFDSSGRRHTSFASIDVIPDVSQDIQIDINEADLRIDVFRASGAGGQHVNRTNSAVRITHLPTNIVVQCQNEKSQHRNKDTAMQILRGRLYERELRLLEEEHKSQYQEKDAINFGSQIRTYTLQPYRLVKDHRTGTEVGDVDSVLNGNLDTIIKDLLLYRHAAKTT
ncbi:Peptide chain release factor 2 [uncultured delta proteobacterium]|uniref:Peptide chain release factor 2 n=1 Tax=uncultured delta proteobacterium TaxID=34034 RepID=A0A212JM47_9DELT|nr:Peptide chain release factor 2 [uncultured delta proteobacterium]